jgi:hypothetical protein
MYQNHLGRTFSASVPKKKIGTSRFWPKNTPKFRVSGDLENEPTGPPLVKQLIFREMPDWKTAQHERPLIEG